MLGTKNVRWGGIFKQTCQIIHICVNLNNGKTNKLPVAGNPILIFHAVLILIMYTQVLLVSIQI